jgi:hypothetical protein
MVFYKHRKRYHKNGYVIVEYPEHPRAFDTGASILGVYEHILVAEDVVLGRPLKEGEVVHHLDFCRNNNSPDNLLVLSGPMHGKLHKWLGRYELIPDEKHSLRMKRGCIRCAVCEFPINHDKNYCSHWCYNVSQEAYNACTRNAPKPSREELQKKVWEKPSSVLCKEYSVSDTAIKKWCRAYSIDKPPRGYWAKLLSKQ